MEQTEVTSLDKRILINGKICEYYNEKLIQQEKESDRDFRIRKEKRDFSLTLAWNQERFYFVPENGNKSVLLIYKHRSL